MQRIQLAGESVLLLPQRALLLEDHATLLIADAHIGKAQSFRRLGVPVPQGTTADNLRALDALIVSHTVQRLVFLGDLLHSPQARSPAVLSALADWRARHATVEVLLVRGNHDRRAGDPPAEAGIAVVDAPWRLGPWALQHHPEAVAGAYAWAGHLHPCVSLRGRANDRLRLPCFHLGPEVGVLPAFGAFTGMHAVERVEGDRVFAVTDDTVLPLP